MSVPRNWTGGDLGSIALCVGVLVHHLASRPSCSPACDGVSLTPRWT